MLKMRNSTGTMTVMGLLAVLITSACSPPEKRKTEENAPSASSSEVAKGAQHPAPSAAAKPMPSGAPDLFADVAEQAVRSVVNISSVKVIRNEEGALSSPFFNDPFFRHFFTPQMSRRMAPERRQKSLGSGVIVSRDGVVLTNNHVVAKADKIIVSLADDEREYEAEIVGTDPKSDVAVLRLKENVKNLEPLPVGDSGALRLGEMVLAVGNPFGLKHTVTFGIVSAKGRADVGIVDYEDFIQTDAAINPGNSGGALVNLKGELVGINTAILSRSGGYQGIGFAIPTNMAKPIMDSLIQNGRVVRGWLGVSIQDVTPELAEALQLSDAGGVLLADVVADGPAAKAGLQRGDVVLRINAEETDSAAKLRNLVAALGSGGRATIEYTRDKKKRTVTAVLSEMPATLGGVATVAPDQGALGGLTLGALNPVNRDRYEIPKRLETGVVVTKVEGGSPAHEAGLKPGDVLVELNRARIPSVQAFSQLYRQAKDTVLLLVYRQGNTSYLVLRR